LLASRFEPQFRAVALPLLQVLAKRTRATAFISVPEGENCVVIMVAETEEGLLRVGYRLGSRHPLNVGAAGIAILAGRPPRPDDSEDVIRARLDGYSLTRGQLQRGAVGIASPIYASGTHIGFEASIGVVAMDDLDTDAAVEAVTGAAARIAQLIAA
jgi:DNA-binding IclR family transcriptional regulator